MRRHNMSAVLPGLMLALTVAAGLAEANGQRAGNLHYLVKRGEALSVYLDKFLDYSGTSQRIADELPGEIKEALLARPDIRFNVVEDRHEADIYISGVIEEYAYSEKDPVDMLMGASMIALDMLKQDAYIRVIINCTVRDAKTGSDLWVRRLRPSITKPDMSEEEGLSLLMKDAAKLFVSRCFARPRKRSLH